MKEKDISMIDPETQIVEGLRKVFGNKIAFHKYNYAYPGWEEERIRARIRQGVGGPKHLEVGAEVHGHLHLPSGQKLRFGDVHPMKFGDETWNVEITVESRGKDMIVQDEPGVVGYEIQGRCVEKVSG